jgi:hypothetical protein
MMMKALTALTPEMACDQTAIGLPPFTSTLFLMANHFGKMYISDEYLRYPKGVAPFGDN